MANIKTPRKLIEVALPLDDINVASAREKSIRHGHPSTLHLWWARRPLAAARAVLFAQLVNDPGFERHLQRGVNKEAAQKERERLFGIMRRLVKWENINNEEVINEAQEEIRKSWRETCELNKGIPGFDPDKLPAFHDPFAGGGSIPLEAQRLGLETFASDLNPIAVMINKAMVEIPPKFFDLPPVNPETRVSLVHVESEWKGVRGLVDDIQYYGQWIKEEAQKRIGYLYPTIELPQEYEADKATIIAWIWARTVKSPNPAFSHLYVPLMTTFYLSLKPGKETYLEPVITNEGIEFIIKKGTPENFEELKKGTKLSRGSNFRCLLSGTPITPQYIKAEGRKNGFKNQLLAIVAEGKNGRIYLPSSSEQIEINKKAKPVWIPDQLLPKNPRWFSPPDYGMDKYSDLFTDRQLIALTTFSDLVNEVSEKVYFDGLNSGRTNDLSRLDEGGIGARAYADAIAVYLSFAIDKSSNYWCTLCPWLNQPKNEIVGNAFGRQALPMVWDFAEANPFSDSGGNIVKQIMYINKVLMAISNDVPNAYVPNAYVLQADATTQNISSGKIVSTDPPYYDNIGYADLSDFFYIWMRRSLRDFFPSIFATLLVPKEEELVATPYRHGGKEKAEAFFLNGMTQTMHKLAEQIHPAFPITIYYAFKQADTGEQGTASTGWQTFLSAVIQSGFSISGTWPIRTERDGRMVGNGTNALASSIILVCRPRQREAQTISRRSFIKEINESIPESLETMIGDKRDTSPVAAVDLQQASIGPGMSVFSKYVAVLESDGTPMTVRTALQLINRVVDSYLNASDGELDAETLFCMNWLDQYGWNEAEYGQAEVLATAKGTTVEGMKMAGVLESGQGKVRLFKWLDYPAEWRPEQDNRTPVWEALHQLIRALQHQGEQVAGNLLAGMPSRSETIRNLAYRLYTLCERKGWSDDARAYNELIASWDAIDEAAHESGHYGTQIELF